MKPVQTDPLDIADFQSEITLLGLQPDQEALQRRLIEGLIRIFSVEKAVLFLLDENNEDWLLRKELDDRPMNAVDAQIKKQPEWVHQLDSREGAGLVRECLRTYAPVLANQGQNDERFDPSSDAPAGFKVQTMLCAPLLVEGHLLGAVQVLNRRDRNFDAYDQSLLEKIVSQAAALLQGSAAIQRLRMSHAESEATYHELTTSRDILRALFDHLPMALYIVDQDYHLLAINRNRALQVHQPSLTYENQICYRALFNRLEPCVDCRVRETFQESASTQRTERRNETSLEMDIDHPGEEVKEWEINTFPIFDDQGNVRYSIVLEKDITEKYLLENILARSEKLAVIGQLAAGVAHEINNPLTAIIANAQILHRELPPEDDLQESVDLISRAGARAAQVVRNLLDFARKEDYHLGLTYINETVERALELIRHEIMSRGVRLKFKPDQNLPLVLASEDHLQSVWLNLLLNAIDALDKDPGSINVTTCKVGSEILISISDNGKGIPPERLTRIFEPFFTTKAPGRGTGLGLSVSHRIVRQHGGRIRVESKVGSGSEFSVILPAG